ncbi:hypothetical protein ACFE04_030238 [Oxalis oulophora]
MELLPPKIRISEKSKGKGRKRLTIAKIENKESLKVICSKRRKGLFSKAEQLSKLCGAQVVVLTFSPSGKPYCFAQPSLPSVVNRYLETQNNSTDHVEADHDHEEADEASNNKKEEEEFWWDSVDLDELESIEELQQFVKSGEDLQMNLSKKIRQLRIQEEEKNGIVFYL